MRLSNTIAGLLYTTNGLLAKSLSVFEITIGIIWLGTAVVFFIRKKWSRIIILVVVGYEIISTFYVLPNKFNYHEIIQIILRVFIFCYMCKPSVISYYNQKDSISTPETEQKEDQ